MPQCLPQCLGCDNHSTACHTRCCRPGQQKGHRGRAHAWLPLVCPQARCPGVRRAAQQHEQQQRSVLRSSAELLYEVPAGDTRRERFAWHDSGQRWLSGGTTRLLQPASPSIGACHECHAAAHACRGPPHRTRPSPAPHMPIKLLRHCAAWPPAAPLPAPFIAAAFLRHASRNPRTRPPTPLT